MVDVRTKDCPTCGNTFSYEVGKGKDRKHCSKQCRLRHKGRSFRNILKLRNPRVPRTPTYTYRTGAGYIKVYRPGHPLAASDGTVFEHRHVAYERHGGECPACYWCNARLSWATAVVDHLNEAKSDNRPDNLVVACNDCNRARGAMLPFLRRVKPDSQEHLLALVRTHFVQAA